MPRKMKDDKTQKEFSPNKCPYITYYLECMLGGEATIECLDATKHNDCEVKMKLMKK